MKLITERNALLKALGHVTSVVERRNTIPILSNMLLRANDSGQLLLTATDLDIEVVETAATGRERSIAGKSRAREGPAHFFSEGFRRIALDVSLLCAMLCGPTPTPASSMWPHSP